MLIKFICILWFIFVYNVYYLLYDLKMKFIKYDIFKRNVKNLCLLDGLYWYFLMRRFIYEY